ncbi:oligopeptide ABC transporter substrate-binding lipoprotein [Mycoplasmopsis californica]|uniref:Oligopeptide ABC transporter substrate-binding lipoprotein n=1 Tax=Mycoplasmopsis californica TaxID=2113 RepID=A0A059XVR0_9BACT|nr:ABC transporter substrate-binding protein [Mycoplasmopsis californica]AIA29307.1 oligopeptide ABC transporter substrate-binding lipoprotein [Mycoplasmopsis californica]
MKLKAKILLNLSFASTLAPFLVVSCANNRKNYDLGLSTDPINSLNYIKYPSVNKILPTLVEPPLKAGPNETIKRISNIPQISLGTYQTDGEGTLDSYLESNSNPENSGTFYRLDDFGSAPGNINTDQTEYHALNSVITPTNKFLSTNVLLNEGQSKWSNGDPVTADDYIDAMHYIFDLSTGSQKVTTMLQRKFKSSSEMIEVQQRYIQKHNVAYANPFAYPPLKKVNGKWEYDVFNPTYQPWASQVPGDDAEVEAIKKTALNLGFYSGRMYWNLDNKTVLSSIPYSPDFDFEAEETILMLPNPEYSTTKHTETELQTIPQRIATRVRKYPYFDPKQTPSDAFKELVRESRELKHKLGSISYDETDPKPYNEAVNKLYVNLLAAGQNTVDNDEVLRLQPKKFMRNRVLALDEYTLRIAYDDYQPTNIHGTYSDVNSILTPINRRFVESIGGINEFGLKKENFLTNGAFTIEDLVLGPQGFILLKKNNQYYSASKTISNYIKLYFSNDPNINSAMFEDGYISATKIPPVLQWKYWTNTKNRPFMNKSNGYGTIAFAFNLDKETNGNSIVNDNNLRSAIYYAINRNELLNIVGWSSSFPVITWTAFGQAASSFGDAVEAGFEHDFMFAKYGQFTTKDLNNKPFVFMSEKDKQNAQKYKWGTPVPVQNYTHLDHIAKSMKFETVDRTDKGFHLDVAQGFMDAFKKEHPELKNVTLRMITNSTDEQKNAGIALKDFMRKAFGDYINIEIKNLPENVYEDWRTTGQYDLIYRNFDAFGSDIYSYIRVFLKPDGIDTKSQKTTGFRNNPSGSWTYHKYFSGLGYSRDENNKLVIAKKEDQDKIEELKARLRIASNPNGPKVWEKIVDLSLMHNDEDINDYTKRHMKFLTSQFTPEEKAEGWTEVNAFAVIAGFEKIVRETAPVIPLMEVDTYWEISRVNGASSLFTYALQYAYDVLNPPRPGLPTIIK